MLIKILIECVNHRSIKGVDQHSTADAFSAHDPKDLSSYLNIY